MAARWNLLMTSSVCLLLCSLCITEQSSEDRGAMLQVGRQVFEYKDHTYTFHYERSVTWEEARSICARESKGSYLAVIEDMDEAEFVAGAMAGSLHNFVFLQDVWIGGHYVTDRWIWDATGDVIPGTDGYPPWGLSAGIRGMDCLLLGRLLWNRTTFQELQCNRRRWFLCEIGCIRLSDNDRGHWEPAYCVEQAGEMGDKCMFVCNPEYQHSGSDVIECTGVGWNGTGGFGILPKCISDISCIRLSDTDRGHWEPAYCAEQAGEMGDKCKFVCNPEYQHSGSDVIECTGVGWNGTGGFGILPKCISVISCIRLSDNDRGHWEPAYCAEQAGEMGDKCKFVCNPEYQHSGSDVIECTGVGWNGTGGFGILPKCLTPKELGEDFGGKINDTLSIKKKAGYLMFKDTRHYEFLMDLTTYKALTTGSPLSANRSTGIITFNYTGNEDLHYGANHKCKFLDKTDELEGPNFLYGRDHAWWQLETYRSYKHIFVFLVTEDSTEYYHKYTNLFAENLKSKGQIEFTIEESNYQLHKLATKDDEGPPNFLGFFLC